MIVIGTHGRGGIERLILGSVADRVLRTATCPGCLPPGVNVNILPAQLEAGLGATAADATSLRQALGRPVDRNMFAASVLNQLEKWLVLYRSNGPDAVARAWCERDMLDGHRVAVTTSDRSFTGRAAGIDAQGFLQVDDDAGIRHTVVSRRFDFWTIHLRRHTRNARPGGDRRLERREGGASSGWRIFRCRPTAPSWRSRRCQLGPAYSKRTSGRRFAPR